jgi:predicted NUDIX family NTP pyrophosphohydrolase
LGSWSIPKGEYEANQSPWAAAVREFEEETGTQPTGVPLPLGEAIQPSGKRITAFALEGDLDVSRISSNDFNLEWPPKSGRMQSFPEIDRAEWFPITIAEEKIVPGQKPFLDRLRERIRQ